MNTPLSNCCFASIDDAGICTNCRESCGEAPELGEDPMKAVDEENRKAIQLS